MALTTRTLELEFGRREVHVDMKYAVELIELAYAAAGFENEMVSADVRR